MTAAPDAWPQHPLSPLPLAVGPAAWRLPLLAGDNAAYFHARPTLLVVTPDDDDDLLTALAPTLPDWPILIILDEPDFARRLPARVRDRVGALGRQRVWAVAIRVVEPADLKAGSVLQTLFDLRGQSLFDQVGLMHDNILGVEWLAGSTAVRLLILPYGLENQAARCRALPLAAECGQACLSLAPAADDTALRFALGDTQRVLPILDRPIPPNLTPMSPDEIASVWNDYRRTHPEPPPLPRSRPPE